VYPLTATELEATKKFIKEHEGKNYIQKADSPWSTPWFFIKKKDGSLRPIQDYREVNKWTICDVYPIPRIEQIMEQLKDKRLFTKFDVRSGYHNICIKEEDQWKAAFKTPYGLFQLNVMFFGLTNSLATFQRFMDRIFCSLKNKYPEEIFVYMDDVLIATGDDPERHQQIVKEVLEIFKKESLFLKLSKCEFEQEKAEYLGILVEKGTIHIDPTKRNGLKDWPRQLSMVKQVRSTLGVLGYQ
jgi:Reverse transcriptase (RNA-dependent DNA polymerase)